MTSSVPGPVREAPDAPGRPPGSGLAPVTAGWPAAVVRGLAAVAVTAALGQSVALMVSRLGFVRFSPGMGWLYTCLFNRVPLTLELRGSFLEALGGGPPGSSLSGSVGFALLTGTIAAVVVLIAGGREVAGRVGGGRLARTLHGAKVGPPYALVLFLVSLAVRVEISGGASVAGGVTLRPAAPGSLLWPLAIGAVAGGIGGYRSGPSTLIRSSSRSRRAEGALAGGWRMLAVGIALSLAGLVALAVVRPDQAAAYFRTVFDPGRSGGAVLLGHQMLALPNHGMLVLAPATGSCDGVYGRDLSIDLLCLRLVPDVDLRLLTPRTGEKPSASGAPAELFGLLLVPAIACLVGGRHAARRSGESGWAGAAAVGAAAGLVFSILVLAGAWLSGLRVSGELFVDRAGPVFYGPRPFRTGLLALAWGVAGGVAGAVLESRGRRAERTDPAPG